MSDDGADLGLTANQGLKAVLGGEEPKGVMTTQEQRDYLLGATMDDLDSYDGCARLAGKFVLEFLTAHPELSNVPADSDLDWPRNAEGKKDYDQPAFVVTKGLYDYMKEDSVIWPQFAPVADELTGFMWGWAVNAARRCLELPPVPNPAILEISVNA